MSKIQEEILPNFRRTGRVIAEFDQTSTPEIKTYPGGYCAGLTMQWLALRAGRLNWPAKQASPQAATLAAAGAATYGKYTAGQAAALKDMSGVGALGRGLFGGLGGIEGMDVRQREGALKTVLGDVKLTLDASTDAVLWSGGEGRTFMHEVAVLGAGLYYIGIVCQQGSHALGLHVDSKSSDSPCEFFDSNVAQLHFKDPDELRWAFDGMLHAYRKIMTYDFKSGSAHRVLPPQLKMAP